MRILASFGFLNITSLLLITVGCSQEPEPIRIGINPWPGYEFLHLAQHKGFFEELGVSVELVEFSSLGDNRRAYERGQIDAFAGTLIELILIHEQSERRPEVFMLCDYSNGADMLLAKPEIKTLRDLKGKRIAMEPASLDVIVVANVLHQAGLTFEDIRVVPTFQNEMPEAFAGGLVDAVQTYPPSSIAIMEQGNAHKLFDTSKAPGLVLDLLAADEHLLVERAGDFTKIILAFDRAVQFYRSNEDEAITIMARRERISEKAFREALAGMVMIPLESQPAYFEKGGKFHEALAVAMEGLKKTGLLTSTLNSEDCYNAGPSLEAVSK